MNKNSYFELVKLQFLKRTIKDKLVHLNLMKYIKIPLLLLWRIWFYTLIFVTILLISPIMLILTAKKSYYPTLWKLVRVWSKIIIYGMGFRLQIEREQALDPEQSYMFCPNHTSLLDPFILMILSKNPIVFVGKKSLEKIPVFGFFYRKTVIMVDRSDPESRKAVFKRAKSRLRKGTSVVIFPEGLVPKENVILSPFKKGAFSLAIEFQIPIVPQIYFDTKRSFSWNIYKGGPGIIRVKQLKFIKTENLTEDDLEILSEKTYKIMYNELKNDELYMKDTNRNKNEKKS